MKPTNSKKGFFSRISVWLAMIAIIAIAGIGYGAIKNRLQTDPILDMPTYEVQQGALTVSISVSGTVQARNTQIIKNELEGNSTILFLVPEGSRVKQGDLLVELDASSLIDQRVDQQIMVQNAEASYINARENLAIVESQAKSDIDAAKLAFDFAQQDLQKYVDGEFPKLQKEAESKIKLNEEELVRAEEQLKWSQILFDEEYLSQTELQQDELAKKKCELNLQLSRADLELLNTYTYKRQVAQLESDVSQAEMSWDRTQRQANANIVQASAELQAKLSEFDQQKSKLAKMEDQIGKAKLYAPMDGLVVYATSVRMGRRFGNDEPLEEGRSVREREELIHLPTTASYMAEVKINESSLEKIRIGLPVRITVDAIPGKVITGKVGSIAPLPDAQNMFMNPDLKLYDSQIFLDGSGEDLRSGMSCQAEIIVDYFQDTTYVPVQAVLRIAGKPTVFVAEGSEWKPREVDLGPDNNRLAQIKSGLKKGELVLLTPPLSSAELSDEDRFKEASDIPEIMEEVKQNEAARAEAQANAPAAAVQEEGQGRRGGRGGDGSGGFGGDGQPGGERASGGGEGGFGGGQAGGGRPDFQNMSQEERDAMRQRFQNMSEEEREAMRQQFGNRGGGGGGRQGGSGFGGRQGGEGGGDQERRPRRQETEGSPDQ